MLRIARENTQWGYGRILGELRKLRIRICQSSVETIMKRAGLKPNPPKPGGDGETVWRKFIRLHMNTLVACDFFTKEVVTPLGKRMAWYLAFIHIGTRKVYLSPPTYNPDQTWVLQQGRNVLMWLEDNDLPIEFVMHDRDTKFSFAFDKLFYISGIKRVRTPLLGPDANAYVEAWIGTIKRECLNYFMCFGLRHLDYIAQTFVKFYNHHRPHFALGNQPLPTAARQAIGPSLLEPACEGPVRCRKFLGGLLRHYERDAA